MGIGFINEKMYPKWLVNIVLARKADGNGECV